MVGRKTNEAGNKRAGGGWRSQSDVFHTVKAFSVLSLVEF
jgi:hypothetical protein